MIWAALPPICGGGCTISSATVMMSLTESTTSPTAPEAVVVTAMTEDALASGTSMPSRSASDTTGISDPRRSIMPLT